MKVLTRGPRALLMFIGIAIGSGATTGCLIEKERNPGARAAQRAAERRRTADQARKAAEVQGKQSVEIVNSAAIATVTRTGLALTISKNLPAHADQIVATLEPTIKADFDCSTLVARRTIDRYSGEVEMTGSTSVLYGYALDPDMAAAPVIYREVFPLPASVAKIDDISIGDYRLTLELVDGVTGEILQSGSSEVSIKAASTSEARVKLVNVGDSDSSEASETTIIDYTALALTDHESGSGHPAETKPYSSVCPNGRIKAKAGSGGKVAENSSVDVHG